MIFTLTEFDEYNMLLVVTYIAYSGDFMSNDSLDKFFTWTR